MKTRYRLLAAMLVALTAMAGFGTSWSARAAEASADLQSQGMEALKVFWTAVVKGTPEAFDPVLAPEFQLERADGSGLDKQAFLKSQLPKFAAMPEFTKVSISGSGDLLVVRYLATADATRGGKRVQ